MAALKREYDYAVDYGRFTQVVMPEVWRRLEGAIHPMAQQRGLQVSRSQKGVKTETGHPVVGIENITWRARKGLAAGFTVELEHSDKNYLHVKVEAKPYYPVAWAVSVALGVLISYFWMPYLWTHWNSMISNPIFIVALIAMWLIFVFLTHWLFLSVLLAAASTYAFGFIAGYGAGWIVGMVIGDSQAGGKIRPALAAVISNLEAPTGAFGPPMPQPVTYGAPPPRAPTAYTPPPAPPVKWATPVSPPTAPAPTPADTAPCPRCGKGVTVGAPSCSWCGLALVW